MSSKLNGTGVTFSDSTTMSSGQQAAKAWVNFVGSSAAINGSFNVSSITRNAAGSYVVNFTTAMANANYAVATTSTLASGPTLCSTSAFCVAGTYTAPTTTSFTLGVQTPIGGSGNDPTAPVVAIICGS